MKYQVSFRAKTWYLHMWKYHHCYGFIINRPFRPKNFLSKMLWHFIGVYIINRILHGRLEIRNFSSRVKERKENFESNFYIFFLLATVSDFTRVDPCIPRASQQWRNLSILCAGHDTCRRRSKQEEEESFY